MRRVKEKVPIDEAIRRVQVYARERERGRTRKVFLKANEIAYAVWPGATFLNNQGAALAAGGIIARMQDRNLIRWNRSPDGSQWGWQVFQKPAMFF